LTATPAKICKRLGLRFLLGTVIFISPAYAIKWGQVHPHISWPTYLQNAVAVGLLNSPLAHREFYSAHFRWQELACLVIFVLVSVQAEYLLARYGVDEAKPYKLPQSKREWASFVRNEDHVLWFLTVSVLYLYVASCALCERTHMGTVSTSESIDSTVRQAGILVVTYFLFKTIKIIAASVTFNGMVVRSDVQRAYRTVSYSLAGIALAFMSWFPLLAIPGLNIATDWMLTRMRETTRRDGSDESSPSETGQSESNNEGARAHVDAGDGGDAGSEPQLQS
jgi:hypothetical protein